VIINQHLLLKAAPIKEMIDHKVQAQPTSFGLTECGYDIRLKQGIVYTPSMIHFSGSIIKPASVHVEGGTPQYGNFALGSSIEEFDMPNHLMGRVLNKSTWARKGVDASLTTNIEPGWKGFLTIELVFNGPERIWIPAGSGICQIIFETLAVPSSYVGKYQNQADEPVASKTSGPVCIMDGKGVYPERLDPFVEDQKKNI